MSGPDFRPFLIEVAPEHLSLLEPLFSDWQAMPTLVKAVLKGQFGSAWTDDIRHPEVAILRLGHFSIVAGSFSRALNLRLGRALPIDGSSILFPDDRWFILLEKWGCHAQSYPRMNMAWNPNSFNPIPAPRGCVVLPVENDWARRLKRELSHHLVGNYENAEDFVQNGVGFVATANGEALSAATSYVKVDQQLEFQIWTRQSHRQRGLGAACASALLSYCLEKKITPHWDAANLPSLALAKKLGFVENFSYKACFFDADLNEAKR